MIDVYFSIKDRNIVTLKLGRSAVTKRSYVSESKIGGGSRSIVSRISGSGVRSIIGSSFIEAE
jgi:hypothetical protein